ncbi:MAG TPA: hypothetical protein VG476_02090, partial [Acidimicrobiales bacterium]|nr:hypothetical protein [Acidimicrobiales bacterium]
IQLGRRLWFGWRRPGGPGVTATRRGLVVRLDSTGFDLLGDGPNAVAGLPVDAIARPFDL